MADHLSRAMPHRPPSSPQTLDRPEAVRSRGSVLSRWKVVGPLLPASIFLLFLLVLPLAITIWYSLRHNLPLENNASDFGLSNYIHLARHEVYRGVFTRTLRLCLYVVVGSLLIGYPTALVLRRLDGRANSSTLILGLSFPILAGPLVVVMGWMILLVRNGQVNRALIGLGLVAEPLRFIGTETAVVVALIQFTLAFVVFNIFNSLVRIDSALLEAASGLGASPLRAFWYVTWPLSLPGVLSGTLLAFALAASAFVAPHYLGGNTNLVATTLITQFMGATFNWELASTVAVVLIVLSLGIILIYNRFVVSIIERGLGVRDSRKSGISAEKVRDGEA